MRRPPRFPRLLLLHAPLIAVCVLALILFCWYVQLLNEQVRRGEQLRQVQRSGALSLAMAAARPGSSHPGRRR
jgi:hypothetical protein